MAFSSAVMRPSQNAPSTPICLPIWSSGFFSTGSADAVIFCCCFGFVFALPLPLPTGMRDAMRRER
jgi:hypothetical protein